MKTKITNQDKLDTVLTNIIDTVEEAGSWIKPFQSAIASGMPMNGVSKKEYKGMNVFNLWLTAMAKGYTHNTWFTFNQLKAKKQTVIKGEKSTQVFFFKPISVDDKENVGEKKTIFLLKAYNVFNIEQTSMELPKPKEVVKNDNKVVETAKQYFDNLDYIEVQEHHQPHYNPSSDTIGMPELNDFNGTEEYYSTLGHEFIHSTLHPERCNREDNKKMNKKENYAFEELVAEIGSIFIMARLGLTAEPTQDNSKAYLKSWLGSLKNDKKMLWKASSQSYKAFEFLETYQTETEILTETKVEEAA